MFSNSGFRPCSAFSCFHSGIWQIVLEDAKGNREAALAAFSNFWDCQAELLRICDEEGYLELRPLAVLPSGESIVLTGLELDDEEAVSIQWVDSEEG